jgi:hypothetical protein
MGIAGLRINESNWVNGLSAAKSVAPLVIKLCHSNTNLRYQRSVINIYRDMYTLVENLSPHWEIRNWRIALCSEREATQWKWYWKPSLWSVLRQKKVRCKSLRLINWGTTVVEQWSFQVSMDRRGRMKAQFIVETKSIDDFMRFPGRY